MTLSSFRACLGTSSSQAISAVRKQSLPIPPLLPSRPAFPLSGQPLLTLLLLSHSTITITFLTFLLLGLPALHLPPVHRCSQLPPFTHPPFYIHCRRMSFPIFTIPSTTFYLHLPSHSSHQPSINSRAPLLSLPFPYSFTVPSAFFL